MMADTMSPDPGSRWRSNRQSNTTGAPTSLQTMAASRWALEQRFSRLLTHVLPQWTLKSRWSDVGEWQTGQAGQTILM